MPSRCKQHTFAHPHSLYRAVCSDKCVGSHWGQGAEREVVIVSVVRTRARAGSGGGVGFLDAPQRTNVAITRARRHLIVAAAATQLRNTKVQTAVVCYLSSALTGCAHMLLLCSRGQLSCDVPKLRR